LKGSVGANPDMSFIGGIGQVLRAEGEWIMDPLARATTGLQEPGEAALGDVGAPAHKPGA